MVVSLLTRLVHSGTIEVPAMIFATVMKNPLYSAPHWVSRRICFFSENSLFGLASSLFRHVRELRRKSLRCWEEIASQTTRFGPNAKESLLISLLAAQCGRYRRKDHIKFVGAQPCPICGMVLAERTY